MIPEQHLDAIHTVPLTIIHEAAHNLDVASLNSKDALRISTPHGTGEFSSSGQMNRVRRQQLLQSYI